MNSIFNENCLDTLKNLPDDYIDLVITSPPYDKIRDYKGFSVDYDRVIPELYRCVKPGGVIVWVSADQVVKGSETGTSLRNALKFQDAGFNMRTMIYEKSNFAFPVNNAYHRIFEYMFVFSKGYPAKFHPILDREIKYPGQKTHGSNRARDGSMKKNRQNAVARESGKRTDIWRYVTGSGHMAENSIAHEHPAIFPLDLAMDHIKSWTDKGDLVYDPFGGSGTVVIACELLERKWITSEISEEYCALIKRRLEIFKSRNTASGE